MLSPRANRCAVCDAPLSVAAPVGIQVSQGSMAALPADELPLAAELGKALAPSIHLKKRIGRGGMGIVFLARDESLKRDVAIKVLAPDLAGDLTTRTRFIREAEAAAAVSHPNIVNIYHVGVLPRSEVPYFVMQYVEGPSMAEVAGRMLPEARVRRVIGEVASGLAAAHRRGVVHRDIKPGNIVIDGETGRALLLDFGISAAVAAHPARRSDRLTSEGSYVGTPAYMSPEIASGEEAVDKSDVYSLGIVAYELLTGTPPFPGGGLRVMAAHVHDDLPDLHQLRADLSPEIVELVERSLAKKPGDRPSAQSIVDHLLPGNRTALEWPPPGLAPLRRASAKFRFGLVSLVLISAALLLAISARPIPNETQTAGARATETFEVARLLRAPAAGATPVAEDVLQEKESIWAGGAYATFLLLLLATCFVAVQTVPTFRGVRLARRSGYPWSSITDVMSDMRRDGGDLMSGLGAYAFFSERERNRLLVMRRLRLGGILIAAALAVATLVAWVSGWLASPVIDDQAGSSIAPLWASLAPIGVLAACAALAADEAVLRRRRAQADEEWQGAHLVNKELVSSWVVSAGRTFSGSTGLSRIPVEIVASVVLITVVSATLIIANAAMMAAIRTSAHRSAALSWATMAADAGYASAWRRRDAVLAKSIGSLSSGAQPLDQQAQGRLLSIFIPPTSGASVLIDRPVDSSLFAGTGGRMPLGEVVDALGRLPNPPVASTVLGLENAASSEAVTVWRAAAHAELLPLFWAFRSNAAAPDNVVIDQAALLTIAAANLRGGVLGLAKGDYATAELRARENLAVTRQLTRAATSPFGYVDAVMTDAAAVLDYIGRTKPDAGLVAEAAAVRSVSEYRRPTSAFVGALFADPSYLPVIRLVGDTLLEPAARVLLAQLSASGFCENPREVLFGPAPARMLLVQRASESLADLPGASRLVGPWERWLAESIASGSTPFVPSPTATASRPTLSRAVAFATTLFRLDGMRSRLVFCSLG